MATTTDDYPNNPATTGYLSTGGNITGTLETAGDVDWFRVDLDMDHGYLFTARMADGKEPTITLWNETLNTVQYTNQPGGLYSNSLVNPFVPFQAGNYYVQVSGAGTGGYSVGMRTAPDDIGNGAASARLLAPGTPAAARFDYAFDGDAFRIAAVAGNVYTVTLSTDSGNLGPASFLRLTLDDDPHTAVEGGATISYRFVAGATRDYVIAAEMASSVPPAAGGLPYHVSVSTSASPRAVNVTGSVDGAIRVTYDAALKLGSSGAIFLVDEHNNTVENWMVGLSKGVHVEGNVLTLEPTHARTLVPGQYSLSYISGSLVDANGNSAQSVPASGMTVLDRTSAGGLALAGQANGKLLTGSASTADTVVYSGSSGNYVVSKDGAGFKVGTSWGTASDSLSGIERIVFSQSGDALALSLDGQLGQAFRLYTAAFDRTPDKGGLGFWLHMAESGTSLSAMARGFIDSKEFTDLYGNHPDDATFVNALYRNVLHRDGDSAGAGFWRDALAKGADRADVLAAVSESHENQEQVAGLVGNGIAYTPYYG